VFNSFVTQFTTLKSLDYNVIMTFRYNNNNNNKETKTMKAQSCHAKIFGTCPDSGLAEQYYHSKYVCAVHSPHRTPL